MITPRPSLRVAAGIFGVFALSLLSCGREVTAPTGVVLARHGSFSVDAQFPRLMNGLAASNAVAFEKVRIVLRRADGSIALDTIVLFPPGADSVALAADVKLLPGTGNGGENFKLDLGYMNSAGVVVFTGGPVDLTVVPKGSNVTPPPIQIPLKYSGPGASAKNVVIAPRSLTVFEGQPFAFTAAAKDAGGSTIPNTPIVWATLDPTRLALNSDLSGAGTARNIRGEARLVAQLLTGPADTVIVNVVLLPRSLAVESGNGQTGKVSAPLAQPIVAKVTASDGVGVAGISVSFEVAAGGGSLASATVTTDASGLASNSWTLGRALGSQGVTASVAGLAGSPVSFTATGRSVAPVRLAFTTSPAATVVAGRVIGPLTVTAYDAQGDVAKTFAGDVAIALGDGSPSGPLLGTLTAKALDGVATFGDLRINIPKGGYLLTATASGLASISTGTFSVVPGPAQKLEFNGYPVAGATAGTTMDPVTVVARDGLGNLATDFAGTVRLGLLEKPSDASLSVAPTTATGGVATFNAVQLTQAGEYRFQATSTGLTPANGPSFTLVSGPAVMLQVVSGAGQVGNAGSPLATPILVSVTDAWGNLVIGAGRTITFSASNGGSASPASGPTDISGMRATTWTLGFTPGTQTLTASSTGLRSGNVTALSVGGSDGSMRVFGGDNQYAVANATVLTPPSVIVKDGAGNPVSGVAVTFTPSSGSSITGTSTVSTGSNGIAAVGGWTLGGSGSFTLTASAPGYSNVVFTATVNTVPMSVVSAEKLPNGTQQFSVVGGNVGDTYTWTVNGVVGGNTTWGRITGTGFYTAPEVVPNPATFPVCAQSVQTPANKGCINVTITQIPSAGGEMIVVNDVNWGDNSIGLQKSGTSYVNPSNAQFVRNLVNFTPTGVRSAATKVLQLDDGYSGFSFNNGWSEMGRIITAAGYGWTVATSHAVLTPVASDVKLVILQVPRTSFTNAEVNGLKTFASQGGRIVFIGENGGYYGSAGIALENTLFQALGAQMTNTGSCDAYPWNYGVGNINSVAHQLTTGFVLTGSGSFLMACASRINLGPNDFALMRDAVSNYVLGAIAKIDYTLLPVVALRAAQQGVNGPTQPLAGIPVGLNGWTTTGPPPSP